MRRYRWRCRPAPSPSPGQRPAKECRLAALPRRGGCRVPGFVASPSRQLRRKFRLKRVITPRWRMRLAGRVSTAGGPRSFRSTRPWFSRRRLAARDLASVPGWERNTERTKVAGGDALELRLRPLVHVYGRLFHYLKGHRPFRAHWERQRSRGAAHAGHRFETPHQFLIKRHSLEASVVADARQRDL